MSPALLRKTHQVKVAGASSVEVWGSGCPRREFLHVDDAADATIHALVDDSGETHLNVGAAVDVTIAELAHLLAEVVGWDGEFVFDPTMPDGTPHKLLDVTRLAELGWRARSGLRDGVESTYRWFLEHAGEARGV